MKPAATRLTLLRLLAVFVFVLGKSTLSLAAPCGAGTMQDYVNLGGGGCTINSLKFSNFSYTPSADGPPEIGAKDVNVNTDFLENLGVGLMFAADWSVTGNQELDATIDYDVTVLNNKRLTVESLLINGSMLSCNCTNTPGDGVVSATEDTLAANLSTIFSKEEMTESDSASFPGRRSDAVETIVDVSAGPFSSASVQSVSNLFVVPEPSTWAMMLIGFAGLGYAAWRRAPRNQPAAV